MGRAGDAPAARMLGSTTHEKRQDLTSVRTSRTFTFTAPVGFVNPMTRAHVKLLGPCFKTGRVESLPLHHRLSAHDMH